MKWFRLLLFPTIVSLFGLHAFGQSVADIAKKERERQRSAQSKITVSGSGTTSTSTAGPSSTSPSSAAAGAAKQAAKPGEVTDSKGRNEQFWRSAFQRAREDAKRAATRVELLDLKMKELNTSLLRQTDVYNREYKIGPEITATQKEVDEARKAAEQAQKNIAGLEEELRRSGGPAGWGR